MEQQLSAAKTAFALNLYHTLRRDSPRGNILFSPLSVSSALVMVSLGTRGHTMAQVAETLLFDAVEDVEDVEDVHAGFRTLIADISIGNTSGILKMANRLYGAISCCFIPAFLVSTQEMFGVKLSRMDFRGDSDDAREMINEWVRRQTEGKITELLTEDMVDYKTKLVQVNGIYFKGTWEDEFTREETRNAPFRLNKKDTKTVKMMYQKERFPLGYIRDLKCHVLELPYKGGELSMVILLPDDIEDASTGLEKMEQQLTWKNLWEWTKPENMSYVDVRVHLPKFKLEDSYDLNSHLARLGVKDLFNSGKADLSGMTKARSIFLSKIVHKAYMVNEEGTEATAATAVTPKSRSAEQHKDFVADHPFIFMIRHNPSGSILFLGRLCNP